MLFIYLGNSMAWDEEHNISTCDCCGEVIDRTRVLYIIGDEMMLCPICNHVFRKLHETNFVTIPVGAEVTD
jgi:hypothetical protein